MSEQNDECVVLLSGGMDSATLLGHLHDQGVKCYAIAFNYGQKHARELRAAELIALHYGVPFRIADLTALVEFFPSAQTTPNIPIPEGHYEESSMKATVTPNRNMIMLSIAAAHAISLKTGNLAYAAHAGDHAIYPDCRKEFIKMMKYALDLCDYNTLELVTPFINITKADIVALGLRLKVPYELTTSCYKGGQKACGRCGTCVERLEAFTLNHTKDPISYEDREFWKTVKSSL
jgi:7-cyano-7-deazaguanine synthase